MIDESQPSRRQRFKRLARYAFVAWLLVVVVLVFAIVVDGRDDQARPADVIVVLGAGVRPSGEPTRSLRLRSLHGASLYREGYAPYVLCTGGGEPSEAAACRDVLLTGGVPFDRIFLEQQSRSTIENALFSRDILNEQGWQDAVLVTSRYHTLRATYIFESRGLTVYPAPVQLDRRSPSPYIRDMVREVLAWHWLVLVDVLRIPVTNFPLGEF